MPILDKLFLKNPVRKWISALGFIPGTPVAQFAMRRIAEKESKEISKSINSDLSTGERPPRDFLSRFQEAHKKDPDLISQQRVLALTVANMFAGSDTTAISLRAIFYNLIRNPKKLAKLQAELNDAETRNVIEKNNPIVRWNDVRELPYLSAVIYESLRTHPAAGLPLERIVPAGGIFIGDKLLPAGTNVGCSAWTLHRDTKTWGDDVNTWRPERWIQANEGKKAEMKNSLFSFGAGARTCIGKNISYLEMYKLVPAVLRSFEVIGYPMLY
jgi:cytochrome P450